MAVVKQKKKKCGTCANFKPDIYYDPVCYEITFMDGKKWAHKVTAKRDACEKYTEYRGVNS